MKKTIVSITVFLLSALTVCFGITLSGNEPYRPHVHFTPQAHWMNDPNGMVYHNGEYHLFYQYYPDGTTWGPMHWGHAVSKDLMNWEHLPIALYPDSLGYIFSGSAVVDVNNTSRLGTKENPPMVAVFTYHNPKLERSGSDKYQYQGMAYSLDNGRTWTKYTKNPIISNPGMRDFRDPKVSWNEEAKKWIVVFAAGDKVRFYSSPNLLDWTFESEFGQNIGAHGGVWECPDLIHIPVKGTSQKKWVLFVSINPGGPFGGSATQYFVGDFDGKSFTPDNTATRWIDFGKDNYAGVTWSNVSKSDGRTLFLGWMSNWQYAEKVPTEKWRSAMTLPRELSLIPSKEGYSLVAQPVKELEAQRMGEIKTTIKSLNGEKMISSTVSPVQLKVTFDVNKKSGNRFGIKLANDLNEEVIIGYDKEKEQLSVNRNRSGKVEFSKEFPAETYAACPVENGKVELNVIIDEASVEVFAQDGKVVMTNIVFPTKPYSKLMLFSESGKTKVRECKIWKLKTGM
jgi:Beta-fructosidases (levanase/invertase)